MLIFKHSFIWIITHNCKYTNTSKNPQCVPHDSKHLHLSTLKLLYHRIANTMEVLPGVIYLFIDAMLFPLPYTSPFSIFMIAQLRMVLVLGCCYYSLLLLMHLFCWTSCEQVLKAIYSHDKNTNVYMSAYNAIQACSLGYKLRNMKQRFVSTRLKHISVKVCLHITMYAIRCEAFHNEYMKIYIWMILSVNLLH